MMKPTATLLFRLTPVLALFSCAAPKATVIAEPNAPKKELVEEPEVTAPAVPSRPDDGLRLPDMVTMPGDDEFRTTGPNLPAPGPNTGAVIARPPTDPPSRPKPKDGE